MAMASDLKAKVTKISTIVEYLEDEQINQIEKDILLQAVRDLYTDILLTKVVDSTEEKLVVEEEKTVVEETPVQEEAPVQEEETPILVEEPVQEEEPVQDVEEEEVVLVQEEETPVQDDQEEEETPVQEEEEVPIQKDEAPTQEEYTTNQSYWWLWLIIFIIASF